MTTFVWVIEYTDADGETSAYGVYVSERVALEEAKEAAQEMIEDGDYDGCEIEVIGPDDSSNGSYEVVLADESWKLHRTPLIGAPGHAVDS